MTDTPPKIECLEDRVTFDIGTLKSPYGEPDGYGFKVVLYRDIPNLPVEPVEEENVISVLGHDERYEVLVPKVGKKIVFILHVGPGYFGGPDEILCGPYLAKESHKKTNHEM